MAGPEAAEVDQAQLEQFFRTCIENLGSDATRKALKKCTSIRPGQKIAEIQKRAWDGMGVTVEAGRRAVSTIETCFPDSQEELLRLKKEFGRAVDAAYLRCLEDRRPKTLERAAKMPRNTVLEFLDACGVLLDTEEVQERLRRQVRETGGMPETVMNDVHCEVMELLGYDREHGRQCFSTFGTSKQFAEDRDVAIRFARWRDKNSTVCIKLLNQYRQEGGELHVDDEVRNKMLAEQAKEELDKMSLDERAALLERQAKKVNVIRGLPDAARVRYLERLPEQEKLEIAQADILMITLTQSRRDQQLFAEEE